MVERSYNKNSISIPYAEHIPVWNIFPDTYQGLLRYVTERVVVSYPTLMKSFGSLINNKLNKSPFRNPDFLKTLPVNQRAANLYDFGSITSQIYNKKNIEAQNADSYLVSGLDSNPPRTTQTTTQDQDSAVTKDLIEVLLYTSEEQVILHANGYPIYI